MTIEVGLDRRGALGDQTARGSRERGHCSTLERLGLVIRAWNVCGCVVREVTVQEYQELAARRDSGPRRFLFVNH